ncbi:methylated-DNA--[protein]-cysteine S-methyltransferase [Adhaeretor mobilis]|uniref:methylated-DNA--[protein]-cysteine S-methyltransferase n=1 Tax=Adhaeretor mobilis TaxID=1930276 RepID=A0A517MUY6_9BACT|nr:MGMT family protein [Adhaeretor mobilis]QDS98692.1 Methylated-DNA--protein-cysteine methyltransferase [Adhaeretor mobilis]
MSTNLLAEVEISSKTTLLGGMAVGVAEGAVAAIAFGHKSAAAAERDVRRQMRDLPEPAGGTQGNVAADEVLEVLTDYAAGEAVNFSKMPVYSYPRTSFQQRVIAACCAIPRGKTLTYGQLAAKVGNPGAARAVGSVMSSNPLPLVIPCHRVLAAGGGLGGYSARQGLAMKRRLLEMEGAEF